MYEIWGISQGLDGSQQDVLHGDVQSLEKRVGVLAGFVDTALSVTPCQSKSAICAFAIPAAAPAADQPTTLSSALALHVLTLPAPYLQTHTPTPQHQPSRTSSRLGIRPSGSATSASSRWYLFNASIQQPPEALNRRRERVTSEFRLAVESFNGVEIMMDRRQKVTV